MTPKALRSLRLALGLSIEVFARHTNLKAAEVHAWELGEKPIDVARLTRGLERLPPQSTERTKDFNQE
jgi:DNA-binding transcriptional regulator YiaG